jgi:glycine cleavage system aminomethyltransferase T
MTHGDAQIDLKARGVWRRLACMVRDDPSVVLVGTDAILDGDRAVGYVTSAGYGATVGESIATAMCPPS